MVALLNMLQLICTSTQYHYSIATVTGSTSYAWTAPGGTSIIGQGNKDVDITFGTLAVNNQVITVKAVNACGISNARAYSPVNIVTCPRLASDETSHTFVLYPNPAHKSIHLELEERGEDCFVFIKDLQGRVVVPSFELQNNKYTFDLNGLAVGTYLITVTSNNITSTKKFVVE